MIVNNKINILVVEDDDLSQLLMQEFLEALSCNVVFAENGLVAVNKVREDKTLDLIFMDIAMPIMNGIEATELIRTFNKEIPIVALTAYTSFYDINKTRDAGCNEHFSKPISRAKLNEIIEKYVQM